MLGTLETTVQVGERVPDRTVLRRRWRFTAAGSRSRPSIQSDASPLLRLDLNLVRDDEGRSIAAFEEPVRFLVLRESLLLWIEGQGAARTIGDVGQVRQ